MRPHEYVGGRPPGRVDELRSVHMYICRFAAQEIRLTIIFGPVCLSYLAFLLPRGRKSLLD